MNNDKLFREALRLQNERAKGMKMPDDMEQRVIKSLTPNPSPRRGELKFSLLWKIGGSCVAVAASVLLLIMLNIGKHEPEQPPVIAEVVTLPQATSPAEAIEQPVVAQAEKPKPVKKHRKAYRPAVEEQTTAEPPVEEVVPLETSDEETFPEDRQLDKNNPYLIAAAQLQEVRARGERLDRELAMLINPQ